MNNTAFLISKYCEQFTDYIYDYDRQCVRYIIYDYFKEDNVEYVIDIYEDEIALEIKTTLPSKEYITLSYFNSYNTLYTFSQFIECIDKHRIEVKDYIGYYD